VPLNIVLYNVFGGAGKGPEIYGTEPWHFYIRNLVINFNVCFLLAIGALPLLAIAWRFTNPKQSPLASKAQLAWHLTPFYLWFVFMSAQPHKEERFMYPIYPALALNAAVSIAIVSSWISILSTKISSLQSVPRPIMRVAAAAVIFVPIALSLLRILALAQGYKAPLLVYAPLHDGTVSLLPEDDTLCLGKEWYRFPSSYSLPRGMRAKFVKSEFSGLLPGEFWEGEDGRGPWAAARREPPGMNDMNVEDVGKYVSASELPVSSLAKGKVLTTLSTGRHLVMQLPRRLTTAQHSGDGSRASVH
jgi:alpha-1,2-mannosyltransferase